MRLFSDRLGVLATMHQKERVMAPILERELGIKLSVLPNFNTDAFGTFTREIKRIGNQLEAARLKAEKALALTGETLGFASEGTFGPHPVLPYIACNRELVILLDQANDLELVGQSFSTETNYRQKEVETLQEAYDFALEVGFPEHGLVVMVNASSQDSGHIFKGITTPEQLTEAFNLALRESPNGKVHVETDMRALYNPTRMKNIAQATRDLIIKIQQICPTCAWPGFDIVEQKRGLPCELCHLPTELILSAIYQCKKCNFSQEVLFPNGKEKADPAQCMYCNP
ncbi:MAG TPA: hypothetical protein DDZ80_11480 [Cyanobacteria bacterium UBA8803]|nr:hypothetical protein [Cyanobacteria bacterium UBA8803]